MDFRFSLKSFSSSKNLHIISSCSFLLFLYPIANKKDSLVCNVFRNISPEKNTPR